MSVQNTASRANRSAQSLRFELAVRALGASAIPRLADVDYNTIRDLVPWIAVIDPDRATSSLKFARAGAGIARLVGREAVGFDYLDLVDPAIRGDAFDSAFVMLSRPCGLWQIAPATLADGSKVKVEYTGFPVYDDQRGRGQIIFLIVHGMHDVGKVPGVGMVEPSTEWQWLDLRQP